ncbi:MAG: hypothetical protein GY925_26385 [Actinomycetia bacterium]|nr:hypothetical protein [Actinomycetes bacterium]
MALSTIVKTKHDILTVISDSGAANSFTQQKEPGDFNYDAPRFDLTVIRDNGELDQTRRGDESPCTGGYTANVREMGSATYATLPDICEWRGYVAANWTSTKSTSSDVETVDVAHTIDGSQFGETDRTLTFDDAHLKGKYQAGDPSTYQVSFQTFNTSVPTLS